MLKLEAFNLRTIQDCMHILNEFEGAGISDVRFVRQRLAEHTQAKVMEKQAESGQRRHNAGKRVSISICPECQSRMVTKIVVDEEIVEICKACRWSRYIGPMLPTEDGV